MKDGGGGGGRDDSNSRYAREFHHDCMQRCYYFIVVFCRVLFFAAVAFRRYRTSATCTRLFIALYDNSKSTDCIRPIYGFMRVEEERYERE